MPRASYLTPDQIIEWSESTIQWAEEQLELVNTTTEKRSLEFSISFHESVIHYLQEKEDAKE